MEYLIFSAIITHYSVSAENSFVPIGLPDQNRVVMNITNDYHLLIILRETYNREKAKDNS